MNTVSLIGNLTRDIELRYSQSGTAFASGTIAVRRNFSNAQGEYESDFIGIKAFGKTAELLANHFKKGSKLGANGRIQTGRYENQQGQTIYTTDVVIDNITFIEPKNNGTGVSNNQTNNYTQSNQNATQGTTGGNNDPFGGSTIDDNQLPF